MHSSFSRSPSTPGVAALLALSGVVAACASSPTNLTFDAGVVAAADAGLVSAVEGSVTLPDSGLHREAGTLSRGDAATSCGTTLDAEGCACSPGSQPRRCYVGAAAQAGVGSCAYGHEECVSEGESGAKWGPCVGSVAPIVTCASVGAGCGTITDGCGGVLNCGACAAGQSCGAGGAPGVCRAGPCIPTTTCASLGAMCGTAADNCGNPLYCGQCPGGELCGGAGAPNQCGCSPTSCSALGATCGTPSDGCNGTLDCGSCTAPETCGGGGTANQCGAMTSAGGSCFATQDPSCANPSVNPTSTTWCANATDSAVNGFLCASDAPAPLTGEFVSLSLNSFYAVVCSGGTCGALRENCWTCNGDSNVAPTEQSMQPSPEACQAFCNSQPGTACCNWVKE